MYNGQAGDTHTQALLSHKEDRELQLGEHSMTTMTQLLFAII